MNKIDYYAEVDTWWPRREGDNCVAYVQNARVQDCEWATKRCKKARRVLQAGGYIGLWPKKLSGLFDYVMTFEPVDELREALMRNCKGMTNIGVAPYALGAEDGFADFSWCPHGRSGLRATPASELVKVVKIDEYAIDDLDLLYLDLEGGEPAALEGARETVERCSPTIVVEINPPMKDTTPKTLEKLGYEFICKAHTDHLFKRKGTHK
jgi:FkbM family methyltransferase